MVAVELPANPPESSADAAALATHAAALLDAVDAAVPAWVVRIVTDRWTRWSGQSPPVELAAAASAAGEAARVEVATALRTLFETDVDAQATNPLSILRSAVRHPTAALEAAGVPPVRRDADAERMFPQDLYDLSPASFAAVDPSLHEPGIAWGAAKAHVVLQRRRR